MDNLEIISIGRNQIKKIENLEGVGETLKELWISYNQLERLVSIYVPSIDIYFQPSFTEVHLLDLWCSS